MGYENCNILLTCAGRRNYIVEYFKNTIGDKSKVYTVNSSKEATSMLISDGAFVAPPLYSYGYISYLLKICKKYDIKLLVSLFDLELPVLAENKEKFEKLGVVMVVSSMEVINICNDKLKTVDFTEKLGLKPLFTTLKINDAIHRIREGNLNFPLFVKPRWGMGSIANHFANDENELKVMHSRVQKDIDNSYLKHYPGFIPHESVLIQEKAKGIEYGIDVVNDFNGKYITTFVKRKLAMRSGETDGAITEDIPELKSLGEKIGSHLKHIGNLDVDVFWDGKSATLLEMNARIGGGYPFSHLAGANLPQVYIDWALGKTPNKRDLQIKNGVKGLKGISILKAEDKNIIDVL